MAESGRDKDSSIQNIRTVYSIKNPEEKVKFYNTWATRYEKDLALINYQAHIFAAEILDPVFPKKREDALVLDIACGTGGVAEQLSVISDVVRHMELGEDSSNGDLLNRVLYSQLTLLLDRSDPRLEPGYIDRTLVCFGINKVLQKRGFRNFHGIDGSEGMLKIAESKGLYQNLKKCLIVPGERLPVSSDAYDLVVVAGALSYGLLSLDVLPELLRVTKPDERDSDYMQQLHVSMDELESKGLWTKVVKQNIESWQKVVLETEPSSEYIPGLVAIYRKSG